MSARGLQDPQPARAAEAERAAILAEYGSAAGMARAELAALNSRYEELLPSVALSRCPFTAQVFEAGIDSFGLDGPWWRYVDPVRPMDPVPATLFAFTGALKPGGAIEPAPFTRKPGPEVPFVVPNMLLHDDVKAVLSSLAIGRHTGYVISYFADPTPELWQRFNDWGSEMYWPVESDGIGWDAVVEENEPLDFDIRKWLERGKLQWIAPGDASLTLRRDLAECPYIDLPGRRAFYYIEPDGLLWEPVPQPEVI